MPEELNEPQANAPGDDNASDEVNEDISQEPTIAETEQPTINYKLKTLNSLLPVSSMKTKRPMMKRSPGWVLGTT